MFTVWARKSENEPWEMWCTADNWNEGTAEMRDAVEVGGYEESTMTRGGGVPD